MNKITTPLVSVEWLFNNLKAKDLIIFDATINKVGTVESGTEKQQIKGAQFFDIKNHFSEVKSDFPNTLLEKNEFEKRVRELGVSNESIIVVYDDLGIYSSARVWWMFQVFGFSNIAVLNGGLPEWLRRGFPIEKPIEESSKTIINKKGDFIASFQANLFASTNQVLKAIDGRFCITDARSEDRFYARIPEPRKGLKGGHIPNANSLPFTSVIEDGKMKSIQELKDIFSKVNPNNNRYIFTCGSGITACILALALHASGDVGYAIYDGSWTEWASTEGLPINT